MSDAKQLEALVAFVESTQLPHGSEVKTNERIYDNGVQIVELDIQIHGKVGTTSFAWLIECSDRPGDGPAPVSWIEQLVGRRTRFGFNKVTAVSTTGFSAGAVGFASAQGIELRDVKALAPGEFSWLQIRHLHQTEERTTVHKASITVSPDESDERKAALREVLREAGNSDFLTSSKTGKTSTPAEAFRSAVNARKARFSTA